MLSKEWYVRLLVGNKPAHLDFCFKPDGSNYCIVRMLSSIPSLTCVTRSSLIFRVLIVVAASPRWLSYSMVLSSSDGDGDRNHLKMFSWRNVTFVRMSSQKKPPPYTVVVIPTESLHYLHQTMTERHMINSTRLWVLETQLHIFNQIVTPQENKGHIHPEKFSQRPRLK